MLCAVLLRWLLRPPEPGASETLLSLLHTLSSAATLATLQPLLLKHGNLNVENLEPFLKRLCADRPQGFVAGLQIKYDLGWGWMNLFPFKQKEETTAF